MSKTISKIKNNLSGRLDLFIVTFAATWLMVCATKTMQTFHINPVFLKTGVIISIVLWAAATVELFSFGCNSKIKD